MSPIFGLSYLASVLEQKGITVEVIDCQLLKDYKYEINKFLKDNPVVGISANIAIIGSALDISKYIRQTSPRTKIIMGGPQPTVVYEKLIPEYADNVVIGEGEDTIVDLMQNEDPSTIQGIAYWNNGSIKVTPPRALIDELDKLPYPAWHLFDLEKYSSGNNRKLFTLLITSRGCPNECIYCSKSVHGSKIRLRSLDNVLGEIDYLVSKFGVKEIQIVDENFTFYPQRVKEFCKMVIGRSYRNLRFALLNGMMPDVDDFEMFDLLAKAGFCIVNFGIESGSQEILEKLKRRFDIKKVKKTVAIAKKVKMVVRAFFMIGLPFDNLETIQETIDFAKSLPVDYAVFCMATPLPGTEFYETVEKKGRFLCDLHLDSTNYFTGRASYELNNGLNANKIEKMYKRAYRQFYFRPAQLLKCLTSHNYKNQFERMRPFLEFFFPSSTSKLEPHTSFRGFNLRERQDFLSFLSIKDKFIRASLNFQRNLRLYKEQTILLTVTLLYEEGHNDGGCGLSACP
ncbi:MAG: radical SAM protein [Nitrospirota bacterium]